VLGLLSGVFAPAASAATTFNVATSAQLTAAMSNAVDGDIIAFTGNIVVSGQVTVNKSVTLSGNGFTISVPIPGVSDSGANNSGASAFRVFNVSASKSVTIQNLTIKGGNVQGAGVYNPAGATVTLVGVTISNCRNIVSGGGGGIYNAGTLYLTRSSLIRNSASFGGGFINANTGVMYQAGRASQKTAANRRVGVGVGARIRGQPMRQQRASPTTRAQRSAAASITTQPEASHSEFRFTGNVAYSSGGGWPRQSRRNSQCRRSTVFAYNYHRTGGTSANPTSYALDDFGNRRGQVVDRGTGFRFGLFHLPGSLPPLATNVATSSVRRDPRDPGHYRHQRGHTERADPVRWWSFGRDPCPSDGIAYRRLGFPALSGARHRDLHGSFRAATWHRQLGG
jgi:hypothetical protein